MVNLKNFQKVIIFSPNLLGGVFIGFSVLTDAPASLPTCPVTVLGCNSPINISSIYQRKWGDFGIGGTGQLVYNLMWEGP